MHYKFLDDDDDDDEVRQVLAARVRVKAALLIRDVLAARLLRRAV